MPDMPDRKFIRFCWLTKRYNLISEDIQPLWDDWLWDPWLKRKQNDGNKNEKYKSILNKYRIFFKRKKLNSHRFINLKININILQIWKVWKQKKNANKKNKKLHILNTHILYEYTTDYYYSYNYYYCIEGKI